MEKLSRRNFNKRIALGVAAGTVMPSFSFNILKKQREKIGYALVGLGSYSTHQLAPALQETEHCYLAGIVTGTPGKAKEWSEKYNIPEKNIYDYDSYDEIADNDDIDIIYVVLPNSMHAEYTIRAAEAGKHVISEKPMATSVEDARKMIEACEKNNVKLGIGYRLHYEPYNLKVRQLCRDETFGKLKVVQSSFGFRAGDPNQWRLKKDLAGGGALMDVGVYCIQATRYTTAMEPVAVTAQEFKTDPVKFAEVDETLYWQMEFPDGISADCATSYAVNIHRLRVNCSDGFMELSPAFHYGPLAGRTSDGELDFPNVNEQALHMDDFAISVRDGKPVKVPGAEGLQDMKIIDAIYRSIENQGIRTEV